MRGAGAGGGGTVTEGLHCFFFRFLRRSGFFGIETLVPFPEESNNQKRVNKVPNCKLHKPSPKADYILRQLHHVKSNLEARF